MQTPTTLGEWCRYWFDEIGANLIPCDTVAKTTKITWGQYKNSPIHKGQIDKWLLSGAFNAGLGVICGKLWRGKYEGMYLLSYDFDNELGREEFCTALNTNLERLATKTVVEQNPLTPQKAHVYFISPIPFPDIKAVASPTKPLSIEQKGTTGLIYCAPSPRSNGGRYQVIGTYEPEVLPEKIALHLKSAVEKIFAKYGLDANEPNIPIATLAKSVTYAGDNRHEAVLRIMESLIKRNSEVFDEQDLIDFAGLWNSRHCSPPLESKDLVKQWTDAKKFILRKLREEVAA